MRNYKYIVPIALVAILGCSVYKTYSDRLTLNNEYNEDIDQARQNRKLEVWVNAEDFYLKALELKDSVETRVELGEMYIDAGDLRTAAKWGESVIEDYPKEAVGYEYLMNTYLLQKDYGSCFETNETAEGLKVTSKKMEKIISKIQYEYYLENEYADVCGFSNGFAAVKKNEEWGYLNNKGSRVVESQFKEAGSFAAEVAPVIDEKGKAYYIDTDGNRKIVIDFIDDVKELGYMSSSSIFPVYNGKCWQLYNLDTKEKVGKEYTAVSAMGNGIAAVKERDKWKLINESGKSITDDEYDSVVMDSKGIICRNDRIFVKQAGSYFLIDSKGKKVCDTKFEDAKLFIDDGYAAVKINGKWGYIDVDGKQIIEPEYIEANSFSNGFAAVKLSNGWGYINEKNNKIITEGFDEVKDFNDIGKTFVKVDDKWQILTLYSYNH